jgi:hypothetical protein
MHARKAIAGTSRAPEEEYIHFLLNPSSTQIGFARNIDMETKTAHFVKVADVDPKTFDIIATSENRANPTKVMIRPESVLHKQRVPKDYNAKERFREWIGGYCPGLLALREAYALEIDPSEKIEDLFGNRVIELASLERRIRSKMALPSLDPYSCIEVASTINYLFETEGTSPNPDNYGDLAPLEKERTIQAVKITASARQLAVALYRGTVENPVLFTPRQ